MRCEKMLIYKQVFPSIWIKGRLHLWEKFRKQPLTTSIFLIDLEFLDVVDMKMTEEKRINLEAREY